MTEVKILVTLEQQELAGRGHEGAFWGMGNVPYVDLVTQKSIYIHSHINVNCTLNICIVYCLYVIIQWKFLTIKKRGMTNTGFGRMVTLVRERAGWRGGHMVKCRLL